MRLSVVVPVYNTRPYLEQLLGSFRSQTVQNFELILVNDASTDGSDIFLREQSKKLPWIRYFDRPHAGLSATRNFGLAQCQGDVVALVDADDWVANDYVEATLEPFRRTNCQWTMRPVYLVFDDGVFVNQARYDEKITTENKDGCIVDASSVEARLLWWPSVWNKAFRSEMIRHNWFDEGLQFEDHAFNIRNYALESHFLFHPRPLYYHRREREGQITAQTGTVNQQIFGCFDLWETTIRSLPLTGKSSYLQSLAERLFQERALKFEKKAEIAAFCKRYTDWARARGLHSDPDALIKAFQKEHKAEFRDHS